MTAKRAHRTIIELGNPADHPLRVWIEPWAEEVAITAGERWHIICDSPECCPITIDIDDGCVVFYGPSKSTVRVFRGKDLAWECYAPAP